MLHNTGSSAWCSVTTLRGGTAWEVEERFKKERTSVCLRPIHSLVLQKPKQHCKAIILSVKNNNDSSTPDFRNTVYYFYLINENKKRKYSERSRCKEYGQVQLTEIKKELPLIVLGDQGREKKQILSNKHNV